jgi:hypothetical protein
MRSATPKEPATITAMAVAGTMIAMSSLPPPPAVTFVVTIAVAVVVAVTVAAVSFDAACS